MNILPRYIAREFLRIFAMTIVAFTGIYLVMDFIENMSAIVKAGAPAGTAIKYFALRLPFVLYQGIPAGILLSTLIALGMMRKHNEITAMKGAGIDPFRQSRVLFHIALILGVFMLLLNEWIVPSSNRAADLVWRLEIKKEKPPPSFRRSGIWFREERRFYRIDLFSPDDGYLKGITIFALTEGFTPEEIVTAKKAEWSDSQWILKDVTLRTFKDGQLKSYQESSSFPIHLPYTLEDFRKSKKKPEEMNILELYSYIKRLERYGSSSRAWRPDLHLKISFPFVTLIMVLVGLPFSLLGSGRGGLPLTIGIAFAVGFSYWIILAFSLSLGRSGTLPAVLSAWIPNILFTIIGATLLSRVKR